MVKITWLHALASYPRTANFISISPDAAERTKVVGSSNSTNYVPPRPQNQSRMTSRWRPVRQSHLAFLCLDFFMCKMEIVLVYSALQRVLVMYSAVVRAVGARIMVFFLKKKQCRRKQKHASAPADSLSAIRLCTCMTTACTQRPFFSGKWWISTSGTLSGVRVQQTH